MIQEIAIISLLISIIGVLVGMVLFSICLIVLGIERFRKIQKED